MDWVRKAFDARVYPWFGETMMPPDAIAAHIATHRMKLFEGCGHYGA